MKAYFQLQLKMLHRHFRDFGVVPILAYPLLIISFLGFSTFLYTKLLESAVFVYCFIAITTLFKLGEKKRNDFLKSCFAQKKYFKIRLLENTFLVLPFILFLTYQKDFLCAVTLYVIILLLSFITFNPITSFTIPTPFSKKPFEFSMGFRNTFFIYPLIYWLTYKAIEVNNFNLGVFSLVLLFVVLISYYSKTEKSYYVWIYNKSPKEFLERKMKTAFIYAIFLSLPISIMLSIFFQKHISIIIVFQLACFIYFMQAIVAKYAAYPEQVPIPTWILIGLSIGFPPCILFTFPYLYSKSIEKLNTTLHD